jgi:rubrerythrin
MYIDQGTIILNMKQAQNLENVKTPETLTEREVTRAIRDAIIAEEGAIKQYETVADSTTNDKVKEVLQSIADEEKVHVGELQKLLIDLLSDEKGFLEKGEKEVEDAGQSTPEEQTAPEESDEDPSE